METSGGGTMVTDQMMTDQMMTALGGMMDFEDCEGILSPFFEQRWRDRNEGRGFDGVLDQVEFESFMLLKLGLKLAGKRITKKRAHRIAWDITRDAFAEWFTDKYITENAEAVSRRLSDAAGQES
jgi:hypothetical protein